MIPKIWLINLALAVLVVFSGIKAADVWFDDDRSVLDSKVSERPAERAPEKKISRETMPPETTYEAVLEKNIFSPNRKEYLPPPEPSGEDKPEVEELKIPGKKVVLYGIVLMEGYRKALVTNLEKKAVSVTFSGSGKGRPMEPSRCPGSRKTRFSSRETARNTRSPCMGKTSPGRPFPFLMTNRR